MSPRSRSAALRTAEVADPAGEEVCGSECGDLPVAPFTTPWNLGRRELAPRVARLALAAAWSARHPREPFIVKRPPQVTDRIYYRAADGWEAPLLRFSPPPGASGEPVVLAHGLGTDARSFDLTREGSLARTLHDAGFDVYLLAHRGDRGAVPPRGHPTFDFDDIARQDLPAALDAVRTHSDCRRVLWVGHSLGGLLLYAHLAHGGRDDLAAAVSLCAPVRFETPRSTARLAGMVARLMPAGWKIPLRSIQQVLAPTGTADLWEPLAQDVDGPTGRTMMLYGGGDLHGGLARQIATWLATGSLCDRGDRLDYVEALLGADLPLLGICAEGDRICPPQAAYPAFDAFRPERRVLCLDGGWGHLDPLIGRRAASEVYPVIVEWLQRWRKDCW